ncbi:MBL fold metallo-hydrolase [Undibacterium sp. Di27W]|uniref:MBL fold metallo-hydrolase n=1 Tax=Undibacterium sp. Di27W TaxID=3413036 RepID=UPI003BF3FFE3
MIAPRLQFHWLKAGHCSHPECVAMRGGRWQSVMFPALCGLIVHPVRGNILFDTGYSQHFLAATQAFPERLYRWTTPMTLAPEEVLTQQLAQLGIRAGDINYVVISHVHGDHIAGLRDFPNARLIISRAEYDSAASMSRLGGLMHGYLPALLPPDFADRLVFVEDAASLGLPAELAALGSGFDLFGDASLIAIPLPGHSRGQIGVSFKGDDDRRIFLVGDACWSMDALMGNQLPTWFASRIFSNVRQYQQTFTGLRQIAAIPGGAMLLPSHCQQSWAGFRNECRT